MLRRLATATGWTLAIGVLLVSACGVVLPTQTRVARVTFLGTSIQSAPELVTAFRNSLRDAGWTEGLNLTIDWHYTDSTEPWLSALVAEVVQSPPDVIFTDGGTFALALMQATTTVPIVFVTGDPIGSGLVSNLAHPGGNLTGLSSGAVQGASKRLDVLRQLLPGLKRLGIFYSDASGPSQAGSLAELEASAQQLGVQSERLEAPRPEVYADTFERAASMRLDAVVVLLDGITGVHQAEIGALAARYRLPTMCTRSDFVGNGCLMAYGTNRAQLYSRAAVQVDRILRGARPGDLPVELPSTFDLSVNVKTARSLGIDISPEVLTQVTEWVD